MLILPWQQIADVNGSTFGASIFTANKKRRDVAAKVLQQDLDLLKQYTEATDKNIRSSLKNRMSENVGNIDWNLMKVGGEEANKQIAEFEAHMKAINSQSYLSFPKKLANGFVSIGKSIGTMAAQAGAAMLAMELLSCGFQTIVTAYDNWAHASEKAIDAANETKDSWDKLGEAEKRADEAIKLYGDRYDELNEKLSIWYLHPMLVVFH